VISKPRIAFAGTPEFAVPALEALLDRGGEISRVLTQPDRPAGRGRQITESAIKRVSVANALSVEQPTRLNDKTCLGRWGKRPDVLVVAAYGLLLPEWLLAWPVHGAVNIHASLLPRWRGAAPIQYAILEGDHETGVSIMKVEPGLDAGAVYSQSSIEIGWHDTSGLLHDRLASLGAELLCDSLAGILDGRLRPVPQDLSLVTYAPKVSKSDAPLDWLQPALSLARRVRAFNPWPICTAQVGDGRKLRIHDAVELPATSPAFPGEIVSMGRDGIDVGTGDGYLRLIQIQPMGGIVMPAAAYLNAHSLTGQSFVC